MGVMKVVFEPEWSSCLELCSLFTMTKTIAAADAADALDFLNWRHTKNERLEYQHEYDRNSEVV